MDDTLFDRNDNRADRFSDCSRLLNCLHREQSEKYCIDRSAIVNDRLSALQLAIAPDMGHDGWANDVTLSNIHERYLFTSRFHLYENTKVSMEIS